MTFKLWCVIKINNWDRPEHTADSDQISQITASDQALNCLPLIQDPVVQSVVSLTSSLVVKILTVLVSTISKSQVFLQMQKLLTFFQQKYYHVCHI